MAVISMYLSVLEEKKKKDKKKEETLDVPIPIQRTQFKDSKKWEMLRVFLTTRNEKSLCLWCLLYLGYSADALHILLRLIYRLKHNKTKAA